ncbi:MULTISPECIES: macro domain-containing protein [Haloarcula]|uniref:Appr-1-p processing protein n=1 Tax=Haloarcula pellucida TaxID=1427151 RepID=A0A830GH60_9EURY|nr:MULTISPECIES: macro domain-containing protein [Halomicroarcula]MBX0347255.1 macro domain-containing protein [Halomicroarcula pellucida]MDS0276870.1 macro domain-containing protein [Halomicroarcula sp. S1AR25-4]GGN87766.1 Appr-1-p processing protein [Halomicroarcula pellucida]
MEFEVIQGDIAAQSADALVNAANTSLRMGSGVAGALKRAAGSGIDDEAVAKGPVELGGVATTDAYDLDAEYVVHAAAMPPGGESTAESIRDATRNALAEADALNCESVVLPAIGCGIAGYDFEDGIRIICEEIAAFDPESLTDVYLIAYDDEGFETMQRVADEVQA